MKIFGIDFAPLNIPFERRIQTFAVLLYLSFFMQVLSLLSMAALFYLLFTSYYWISLLYIAWYYYDMNTCQTGGRQLKFLRRLKIWKYFADYFPLNLIKTADLDPKKSYLFALHPHGIMSFSAMNFCSEATGFSEKFPGISPRLHVLNCQFYSPIWREIVMSIGACSASKESLKYFLDDEVKGKVSALIIGGAAEANEGKFLNKLIF
jgi:hypothetical protein